MLRGLISEKDMNSKMTINSQSSTTEPKEKKKLSKQLEQEENHKQRSHGGLSAGRGKEENGGEVTGNKKHK